MLRPTELFFKNWAGHLFLSFKWACCVLAVLGIFSLLGSWACCVWAFRGICPLMQMGMSHIGCFGHVVLSLQ